MRRPSVRTKRALPRTARPLAAFRMFRGSRGEQGGIGHDLVGCTAGRLRGFIARQRQCWTKPRRRLLWRAEYRNWAHQPIVAPHRSVMRDKNCSTVYRGRKAGSDRSAPRNRAVSSSAANVRVAAFSAAACQCLSRAFPAALLRRTTREQPAAEPQLGILVVRCL